MKRAVIGLAGFALCLLAGCAAEQYTPPDYSAHTDPNEERYVTELADAKKLKDGEPVLVRRQEAMDWVRNSDHMVKKGNWGYDLRSYDVSGEDLSAIRDMNEISFHTATIWPDQIPDGFDPDEILERNKNPGLGVRALHSQGITGSGVSIAIVDSSLFTDHEQYKGNLMLYELIHCDARMAQMHGSAVVSLAVGKDIGVAPDAKLYYIGSDFGHSTEDGYIFDASIMADGILRVLELNRHLPKDEKIRVISISMGYGEEDLGYEQLTEAIRQADEAGVFVLTTTTDEFYDFRLWEMGRDYLGDPDEAGVYYPDDWYAERFYAHPELYQDVYLVPAGSRTYAGWAGERDYEISHEGGMSWAVPWCAGFYALCCQVKPDLTPAEFIAAVKDTAVTTEIEHDGVVYPFGNIVNPAGTMAVLQGK